MAAKDLELALRSVEDFKHYVTDKHSFELWQEFKELLQEAKKENDFEQKHLQSLAATIFNGLPVEDFQYYANQSQRLQHALFLAKKLLSYE